MTGRIEERARRRRIGIVSRRAGRKNDDSSEGRRARAPDEADMRRSRSITPP
jgi:hypothetical protein